MVTGMWTTKTKSLISPTPRAECRTRTASMFQTVILVLRVVLFILGTSALDTAPSVDLGYVKYSGFQNATAGINYYRGIPYAVPSLGNLCWREPCPIELDNPFNGQVINASQYGPACYQGFPPYATWGVMRRGRISPNPNIVSLLTFSFP